MEEYTISYIDRETNKPTTFVTYGKLDKVEFNGKLITVIVNEFGIHTAMSGPDNTIRNSAGDIVN